MYSLFEVGIEGGPVIRSNQDVTAGKTPTGFRIRVNPPPDLGDPYTVERDYLDTELLNRAVRLYDNGPTIMTVHKEWLGRHLQTWRDDVIALALERFATLPMKS